MILRPTARLLPRMVLCVLPLLAASCEKSPLLAPTGSKITLTSSQTALSVNGSAQLIAQVIEPAGTPPHSGTHVIFTTSLGTIQPSEASTDVNGRAIVTFNAGMANGTATITASSGGSTVDAANAVRIVVGTAAVGRVSVSANPTLIAAAGGAAAIAAAVADINGNALVAAPVVFATNAGTLDSSSATTDANGIATTTLRTSTTATVTATVGAQGGGTNAPATTTIPATNNGGGTTTPTTPAVPAAGQASGSVTVNVASAPGLVITPPTTPPSAGLPATFTFAVTIPAANGSAIKDLTVNFGDGSPTRSLGAVSTTTTVSYVYNAAGPYLVTATLTDSTGNVVTQTTSIVVIPVPRPAILITQSPVPGKVNTQTTIQIQITLAAGIGVQRTTIDFGDGQPAADLGGAVSVAVPHVYVTQGTFTVRVRVLDTTNQTTDGTTIVSIGP